MTAIVFLPLVYVFVIMVNTLFSHLVTVSEALAEAADSPETLALVQNSPGMTASRGCFMCRALSRASLH